MSYEVPNKTGYFIFSKSNCPACVEIKKYLPKAVYVNCDKYLEEDMDGFLDYVWAMCGDKYPRTFPMVFHDGKYIGNLGDIIYLNNFTLDADF